MANLKTATSKYAKVVDQVDGIRQQCDEIAELVETKKANMNKVILNGGNFEEMADDVLELERKHRLMLEHLSLAEKQQEASALVLAEIVDKNAQKTAREEYRKAAAVISDINRQIVILATKEKDLAKIAETIGHQRSLLLDKSGASFYGWINVIQGAQYRLERSRQWWEFLAERAEKFNA